MSLRRTLVPDLLLDARGARAGVGVTFENGRVVEVGSVEGGERLPGQALAPGFVNAHSHAFQRDLRGRVEYLTRIFRTTISGRGGSVCTP